MTENNSNLLLNVYVQVMANIVKVINSGSADFSRAVRQELMRNLDEIFDYMTIEDIDCIYGLESLRDVCVAVLGSYKTKGGNYEMWDEYVKILNHRLKIIEGRKIGAIKKKQSLERLNRLKKKKKAEKDNHEH